MAGQNSFRVRPAVIKDAAGIAGLCGQLGYPSATTDVERRLCNKVPGPGGLTSLCNKVPGTREIIPGARHH